MAKKASTSQQRRQQRQAARAQKQAGVNQRKQAQLTRQEARKDGLYKADPNAAARDQRQAASTPSTKSKGQQRREANQAVRAERQKTISARRAERLNRQAARQDGLYKRDPRLTAKDEKAKREREADEKRRQEALEKRKAEEVAEKQRTKNQEQRTKNAEQDHLYTDTGAATQAHRHATAVRESKYEPLYEAPSLQVPPSPSLQAPISRPPIVTRSATAMHAASNRQAWSELETQLALLS